MFNPFVINGIVPDKYFCDREKETEKLVRCVYNQSNVLLTSPRRMGKTQLIRHLYQHGSISSDFHTFYVDIYSTTSLQEFILLLGKEIYTSLVPKGRKVLDSFVNVLKSLSGSFGYDALTGLPSFDVRLGDIRSPELTLSEIFNYLETADKPCICTIDEFQQIGKYPEKNVEALLRTHIQKMNNCRFVFAGSDRHTLENMFNSPAKPFYNSVEQMYLDCIGRQVYVSFMRKCFEESGRNVPDMICEYVYDLFEGHTYYVHQTLHNVYAYNDPEVPVTEELINDTVSDIIQDKEHSFLTQLSLLNYTQKETLIAIAKEGEASEVTSAAFVRKHSLQSPSAVQNAIRNLLNLQMITYRQDGKTKVYSVSDRFLQMWIVRKY
ncbi:MAG: ATPase [Bacteroidales bacterium]|nr:ATPase [Bacteroidales bacterium]